MSTRGYTFPSAGHTENNKIDLYVTSRDDRSHDLQYGSCDFQYRSCDFQYGSYYFQFISSCNHFVISEDANRQLCLLNMMVIFPVWHHELSHVSVLHEGEPETMAFNTFKCIRQSLILRVWDLHQDLIIMYVSLLWQNFAQLIVKTK